MTALFDFDGVILDSEPQYDKFWNAQGLKHGKGENFARTIKGQTMSRILNLHFADFTEEQSNKLISDCIAFEHSMECPLINGARKFIEELKSQGVKIGLVTSSDDTKLARFMNIHSMQNWYDTIVTANRVTKSKPDPQGYLMAANDLNSEINKCIVFEDSLAGIEAGFNAKMKVVALATTYSHDVLNATGHADLTIDDFEFFTYNDFVDIINI